MSLILIVIVVVAALMTVEAVRRFRNNDLVGGIAFVALAIMDIAVVISLLKDA